MASDNVILRLPPTAKRSEHTHGSSRRVGSVGVEFILCSQQLTIRIKDVGERDCAGTIGLLGEVAGFGKRLHLALQLDHVSFSLGEPRQRVLDILGSSEDRLAVDCQRLCIGAAGLRDLRVDLSKAPLIERMRLSSVSSLNQTLSIDRLVIEK